MATEVANLKATIEFATRGESQAIRAAKSAQQAIESLGLALDSTGGQAQSLEVRLDAMSKRLSDAQARFDEAKRTFEGMGGESERLTSRLAEVTAELDKLTSAGRVTSAQFKSIAALQTEADALRDQIAALGDSSKAKNELEAAEKNLQSTLAQSISLQERYNDVIARSDLREYTNQLQIATATQGTMAQAQRAAIDEINRMADAGENATGAVQQLNDLVQQQATYTVAASDQTKQYADAVAALKEQVMASTGAEQAAAQASLEQAQSVLTLLEAYDREVAEAEALIEVLKRLRDERDRLASAAAAGEPGAGPGLNAVQDQIEKTIRGIGDHSGKADNAMRKATEAAERLGNGFRGAGSGAGGLTSKLQQLVRSGSQMFSVARGGVSAIGSLATSIGALGAVALGAAAGAVILFKSFQSFLELASVSHLMGNVTENMKTMGEQANLTTAQIAGLATGTSNYLRSIDVTNVDSVTEAILSQAIALKNLTSGGTVEQASAAINQLVRGQASAAEQFGFSKAAFEQAFKALGPYATEAQVAAAAIKTLGDEAARNGGRLAEANANDITSMEDLKASVNGLFESLAQDFGPAIQATIDLMLLLNNIIKPVVVVIGYLIKVTGEAAQKFVDMTKTGVGFLLKFAKPLLDIGRHLPGIGGAIGDAADSLERWTTGAKGADIATSNLVESTLSVAQSADMARAKYEGYLSAVGAGRGVISSIKALGEAAIELEKHPQNADAALNYISALERVYETAINNGDAINALKDFASRFDLGPETNKVIQDLIAVGEEALIPVQEEFDRMGVAAKKVDGPLSAASGSFGATGSAADVMAGQVANARAQLEAISGTYNVGLNFAMNGAGAIGSTGFASNYTGPSYGPSRTTTAKLTNVPAPYRAPNLQGRTANPTGVSGGVPSYAGVYDPSKRSSIANNDALTEAAKRLARIGSGGGGGGGGGGGSKEDRNLNIEEIRKFINTVNDAITAGVRGGVVFSTAGNAIPVGGPGEFVKNEGGVNVGTINLRGVWDFADPAAKREIVRQLQEALAQYEKEVS